MGYHHTKAKQRKEDGFILTNQSAYIEASSIRKQSIVAIVRGMYVLKEK